MERATAFGAWLLKLLGSRPTLNEPGTTDTSGEEVAAADSYDERNAAAWFPLPPV